MASLNKTTLKQKISDFINRVAPFTNPLVQKTEDLEVRTDVVDSFLAVIPDSISINPSTSTVAVDLTNVDEVVINTTGAIGNVFEITLSGLEAKANKICKLLITKKSSDVFTFTNATTLPFKIDSLQVGSSSLSFEVVFANPNYFVIHNKEFSISDSINSDVSNVFASSKAVRSLNVALFDLISILDDKVDSDANKEAYGEAYDTETPTLLTAKLTPVTGIGTGSNTELRLHKHWSGNVNLCGSLKVVSSTTFSDEIAIIFNFDFRPNRVISFLLPYGTVYDGDFERYQPLGTIRAVLRGNGGIYLTSTETIPANSTICFDQAWKTINA